ncbi:hypothetical protein JCM8097_009096 [Rhodosporidiobolus ruineniae]
MVSAPETQQRQQVQLGNGAPPLRRRPDASPVQATGASIANGVDSKASRRSSIYGSIKSAFNRSKSSSTAHTNSTSSVKTLVDTFLSPPPPSGGDGLKPAESAAPSDAKPTISLAANLWSQIKEGKVAGDVSTLLQVVGSATGALDDREMMLEHLVVMLQDLPTGSPVRQPLTDKLLEILWGDLAHPAQAFAGPVSRAADGSGQNPSNPQLGAANTPYARSVPPCHPKSPYLPAPEIVFDALLKRREFKPHPSGISSLLFSFATLIIHSAFQSGREDPSINEASSYLDLSPLYGNTFEEQKTVRTFEQGRLFADVIASSRLFFMPPSVVALLVVFNRNHNYIVEYLYKINEHGKYKPWDSLSDDERKKQDSDLFEKGRLINSGWFLNIIVQDYIRVILNINRTESVWSLAPNTASRAFPNGFTPRGVGNSVSAEFNILYRWHSAISQKDEKWIEGLFRETIGDKPIEELTEADFGRALAALGRKQGKDPRAWTIPGISRTASGAFADEDLCRILTEATDEIAGAFGANGSPAVMKIIDVMGMVTARDSWVVCTMNEFRNFLHLKPFSTFEEWNPDPAVASAARHLYGSIDNLELFPGLHAEAAKPSTNGSGLAVNYTISRAILSDATALVRGDRFFTTDYHAGALTSWGFEDVQPDLDGGSYGGCIGRLLMRALPASYTYNSTYALFPFSTPSTTREILTKNGVISKYDLSRPKPAPALHGIFTYKAALDVLADPKRFSSIAYDAPIRNCSDNLSYFITQEGPTHTVNRKLQSDALFPDGWQDQLRAYYKSKTAELIEQHAWSYDGGKTMMVDIVRDVTNLAAAYWVSHTFGIPLKEQSTPHGLFTPQELYLVLSAFFMSVFMNFDLSASFKLTGAASKAAPALLGILRMRISQTMGVPAALDDLARHLQELIIDKTAQGVVMGKSARAYYERLLHASNGTHTVEQLASPLPKVINFFFEEENAVHKDEIVKLCKLDSPEADQKILAYIWEALRLDPQVPFVPRTATEDMVFQDGERKVEIKKGDRVFPSMLRAGSDPSVFPNPSTVDPTRPKNLYRLFGSGAHTCLGAPIVDITLVELVKAVFRLPNVRRAPGGAGKLARSGQEIAGTQCKVYLSANATPWPLPVSMSIVWDAK